MMINFEGISRAQLNRQPYIWGVVSDVLSPDLKRQLGAVFPTTGFERMRRLSGSDKKYEAWFRAIKQPSGEIASLGLNQTWIELIRQFDSRAYRTSLGQCLGEELDNDLLEITLWRYGSNHFLGPHTDISSKRVAHLFYFNEAWDPSWGGCLRILHSQDIEDIAHEIPPNVGGSVILVRSDCSWHGVSKLNWKAANERRVLQVSFWKEVPRQGRDLPGLEVIGEN